MEIKLAKNLYYECNNSTWFPFSPLTNFISTSTSDDLVCVAWD